MLQTKEEITNYLITNNFEENYICGDGTLCEILTRRIIPEKVFGQVSMGEGLPARHWWIEYLSTEDKFVLHCSYFAVDGTPITREQFTTYMKESPKWTEERVDNLPAVLYIPEAVIEWIPSGMGEWIATYNMSTPTSKFISSGPLNKILLKPSEYVCGGTIVDGIAGFVYGKYANNNGEYYYIKLSNNPQPPCCSELQLENCGETYPQTGICVQPNCCINEVPMC